MTRRNMPGHWAVYAKGTGWHERYRHCLECGQVWRNRATKQLLHKGGKP